MAQAFTHWGNRRCPVLSCRCTLKPALHHHIRRPREIGHARSCRINCSARGAREQAVCLNPIFGKDSFRVHTHRDLNCPPRPRCVLPHLGTTISSCTMCVHSNFTRHPGTSTSVTGDPRPSLSLDTSLPLATASRPALHLKPPLLQYQQQICKVVVIL
jgi:hypothetical protein